MKPYLQMTAAEKRQAVLDALHATGGLVFNEIKQRLGANQSLSSTLNTMMLRGEIEQRERVTGNQIRWVAIVEKTAEVRLGPAPLSIAPPEPKREPHVRVVRLLDKPNRSSGGQCAGIGYGTIQSGMNGSGWI